MRLNLVRCIGLMPSRSMGGMWMKFLIEFLKHSFKASGVEFEFNVAQTARVCTLWLTLKPVMNANSASFMRKVFNIRNIRAALG